MSKRSQAGSTTGQLRDDIDSSRTGHKVSGSDPAAAPLGTDDEAAGTPLSSSSITMARRLEAMGRSKSHPPQRGPGFAWILIVFSAAFGAAIVAWAASGW